MHNIILASSSISRKACLERLQIKFKIIAPHVDETPYPNESPANIALRLAETKARAIGETEPEALIIGADQVIMLGNIRLDKPETVDNAIKQLELVSGKAVDSYTGLCLYNSRTKQIQTGVETYQVGFRTLTQSMIKSYIEKDKPLHCAGSIKAESLGIALFTQMTGRDPTALLGLPLMLLTDMFNNEGINLL